MADQESVLECLRGLVEGRLDAAEWSQWWDTNCDDVERFLKRPDFLKLKLANGDDDFTEDLRAHYSQEEAAEILAKCGIDAKLDARFADAEERQREEEENWLAFAGPVRNIAESEFAANVTSAMLARLHEEYASDRDVELKKWIRQRLRTAFRFTEELPKWVNSPDWPTIDGHPATFLKQFTVPTNATTKETYSADRTVYVFGYRVPCDESGETFRIEHKVVTQVPVQS